MTGDSHSKAVSFEMDSSRHSLQTEEGGAIGTGQFDLGLSSNDHGLVGEKLPAVRVVHCGCGLRKVIVVEIGPGEGCGVNCLHQRDVQLRWRQHDNFESALVGVVAGIDGVADDVAGAHREHACGRGLANDSEIGAIAKITDRWIT